MKNKRAENLFEKISLGIKTAITQLYSEAGKNGWTLVISKNGKIKKIKPT
jgi:hypothetical protein